MLPSESGETPPNDVENDFVNILYVYLGYRPVPLIALVTRVSSADRSFCTFSIWEAIWLFDWGYYQKIGINRSLLYLIIAYSTC